MGGYRLGPKHVWDQRVFEKNERKHKGKNDMRCYFTQHMCGENIHRDYSKLFHLERTCRALIHQSNCLLAELISLLLKKKTSINRTKALASSGSRKRIPSSTLAICPPPDLFDAGCSPPPSLALNNSNFPL